MTSGDRGAAISKEFAEALVKMQGAIEGAKKGKKNDYFKSKYADLAACWDACRDALQDNNLFLEQCPVVAPPGFVGLQTTVLYGPTGEERTSTYHVPCKDPDNPQALGSAITYARRYALCSVIGICPEDDDGNAAAGQAKSAATQSAPVRAAANVSVEVWQKLFDSSKSVEQKKETFQKLRASGTPEPGKTQLLTKWADEIKGGK